MYNFIKNQYKLGRITAAQVWNFADAGRITAAQALMICGPRPAEATEK